MQPSYAVVRYAHSVCNGRITRMRARHPEMTL